MRALAAVALLASACASFESPSIVLDLRVVAMETEMVTTDLDGDLVNTGEADQVISLDPRALDVLAIRAQLKDVRVTTWVADPAAQRSLFWKTTLCLEDGDGRCDRSRPHLPLEEGTLPDPDLDTGRLVSIIRMQDKPTANTVIAMMLREYDDNPVALLGGVDLIVEITIGGVDEPRELDLYAVKKLRISPRIPAARTANLKPRVTDLQAYLPSTVTIDLTTPMPCAMGTTITMRTSQRVTLIPTPAPGSREEYVVPGLDGRLEQLEETLSYDWRATDGSWSDETTGGPRNPLDGSRPLDGSIWTAPRSIGDRPFVDVGIWMIQRDERLGVTPFPLCIRVEP